MEHLREHWRQVTASRRTLYRGISLQGASSRYAWGLDQALVRKFSSAMKKGDHQAAAKIVLDLCEQSGEFVEGGHFGVWWSTDLKVARGYAGMHTRETLGCVIHAEVDDEDINQGHAEQYGYTHESPVVLREGARIDVVAIEVRYNPDLKVLRDGDFVKIPVRRQVTAGVIPATTSTSGPFRTVVDVEVDERGFARERLECGHTGKSGWRADWLGTAVDGKPSKRRCYDCLSVEHKSWLNDRPGSEGHECSDACILPVRKSASRRMAGAHPLAGDLSALEPRWQEECLRQLQMIPSDVTSILSSRGVKVKALPKATMGERGRIDYGGFYDPDQRTVYVSDKGFADDVGRNAKMILHEMGHALDHAVGWVSKLAPFKVLWKDANPRSGSYFQKSLGGTDPRTEMYAEACAAIWGHYQPDGFTLTDDLRTIVNELRHDVRTGEDL